MNYIELIADYKSRIDKLELEIYDVLQMAEAGISLTEKYIKKMREEVVKNGFPNINEEINFFKHIKPQIISKLIYYIKLFNIESKRPRSSAKFQTKYLNDQINKLQVYFNENLEFYHYYRRGQTTFDKQYFVRGKSDLRTSSESFHFFIDDIFCTSQDSTVATIIAFDMLIVYLQQEIKKMETNADEPKTTNMKRKSNLFWTGSKTELIELIYALQSSGVINGGRTDIKELTTLMEQVFNVDLGNYYHTFIEIRARKNSQTKFLEKLIEALNRRFKDADE